MPDLSPKEQLKKMQQDWDERARENARYYVATGKADWTEEEFYASGDLTVQEQILNDMTNICQGKDPKQMRVIEIGCGAGRVTKALAKVFGEVHAVDVSGEMVAQARKAVGDPGSNVFQRGLRSLRRLLGQPPAPGQNAFVYQNNGKDLTVLPAGPYDFAFSTIVFQHIPSREVIYSYVREVHRLLRPGALFKFQVQGDPTLETAPDDTWVGIPFSDADAVEMAEKCGFEPRHRHGAGGQYFWLWFFRL
jgi:SAM-dependent methyltransferase